MGTRISVAVTVVVVVALGVLMAVSAAQLVPMGSGISSLSGTSSLTYDVLFNSRGWLVLAAAALGLLAGAFTRRPTVRIEDGIVERHDGVAIFEHWLHVVAVLVLLGSGIALGFLFIPRLVTGAHDTGVALNLHWVGVVLFAFSGVYYATNTVLSGRLKEHLAGLEDINVGIAHYRAQLAKSEPPAEGKFYASERIAYVYMLVALGLVALTGVLKLLAYGINMPAGVMGVVTPLHDVGALLVALFLIAHVLMGAVVPWSWPELRSMVTGKLPLEYVQHHHKAWYDELMGSPARSKEDQ